MKRSSKRKASSVDAALENLRAAVEDEASNRIVGAIEAYLLHKPMVVNSVIEGNLLVRSNGKRLTIRASRNERKPKRKGTLSPRGLAAIRRGQRARWAEYHKRKARA